MDKRKIDSFKTKLEVESRNKYIQYLRNTKDTITSYIKQINNFRKQIEENGGFPKKYLNVDTVAYNDIFKIEDYYIKNYFLYIHRLKEITINTDLRNNSWTSKVISFLPILDEIYPKRWDIIKNEYIAIHFDDLVIKNNNGNKRLLKDLYILIYLDIRNSQIELRGCRSTLFPDEFISNYRHSHLSSGTQRWDITKFCLGTGPLNTTRVLLKEEPDEDIFRTFLYEIDNYVRWESLGGTPHFRMQDIKNSSDIIDMNTTIESSYIYRNVIKDLTKDILKWNIVGENIELIVTEELEQLILKFTEAKERVYKVDNNYYLKTIVDLKYDNSTMFNFRRKRIKFNVIKEEINEEYKSKEYPHPGITKYIKQRFESDAREILYKETINSRDGGENNSGNIKKTTKSDLATV